MNTMTCNIDGHVQTFRVPHTQIRPKDSDHVLLYTTLHAPSETNPSQTKFSSSNQARSMKLMKQLQALSVHQMSFELKLFLESGKRAPTQFCHSCQRNSDPYDVKACNGINFHNCPEVSLAIVTPWAQSPNSEAMPCLLPRHCTLSSTLSK